MPKISSFSLCHYPARCILQHLSVSMRGKHFTSSQCQDAFGPCGPLSGARVPERPRSVIKTAASPFTVFGYHTAHKLSERKFLSNCHPAKKNSPKIQILTAAFQGAVMALWGLFRDLGRT